MKLLVIYLVLGVVGTLVIIFITGFVVAAFSSKKRFNANALELFDQLSKKEKDVVRIVWFSFKKMAVEEANAAAANLNSLEIEHIKSLFDPNLRPVELSGGKVNDNAIWLMYLNEARDKSFNDTAAIIIAGVGLNGVERFL